jgi:senataxin
LAAQGKQLDVIIFSCVRAFAGVGGGGGGGGGGATIGFLSDVRRLNVAITRAKRSLWVLGQVASLGNHPVWRALLDDAAARHCLVSGLRVLMNGWRR